MDTSCIHVTAITWFRGVVTDIKKKRTGIINDVWY